MEKESEKLQSIQSQIDELNNLLSEVIEPVPPPSPRLERLGILLLKLQDGVLEDRFVRRLEKWLKADPEAMDYYLDFMMLAALLRLHFHPEGLPSPAAAAAKPS
ncbi:MAG TPA: hypothetical protein PK054_08820 [Anaerohalosphaeraceae bacterium]|nr:hypothetical protein [Anaerohalosphaeraceae bacterium]HOL88260.1 hypothetical protein [Anaerohalosphaeraceae bacterium]HPP56670.1 hypothetical protein [Anaerohalosphaeraceae bacterium]